MPFVYRYINTRTMLCVYVGKVSTYTDWDDLTSVDPFVEFSSLSKRHNQHKREDWYKKIGDENLILQYIFLDNHTDADILETWLINYYPSGQLMNKAKCDWGKSKIYLNEVIKNRWSLYTSKEIANAARTTSYHELFEKIDSLEVKIKSLKRLIPKYRNLEKFRKYGEQYNFDFGECPEINYYENFKERSKS